MKTIAIIQARRGSTRLPGKVMMDLAGKPMLDRVVTRVKRASLDDVVVATSHHTWDYPIFDYCKEQDWACYGGEEEDVLDRYYQVALAFRADAVVRITADCPLIDPDIIDECVGKFESSYPIDYVSNLLPRTYPRGLDTEVISFETLKREWETITLWREHVTLNIRENLHLYRIENTYNDTDYSFMKWAVDTEEDLIFARRVYNFFGDKPFGFRDVMKLLSVHPNWVIKDMREDLYEHTS